VGQPREKRRWAPFGVMEALHRKELPLDGVVGLIQQGAGPSASAGLQAPHTSPLSFVLEPASYPLPVGRPRRGGDVVSKVAEPFDPGQPRNWLRVLSMARTS